MNRLVALLVLTAAFAPAAVLGALPLVIPVVGGLTLLLSFLLRDPARTEEATSR